MKKVKLFFIIIYIYFSYLLLLITLQYLPLNFEVTFLKLKQEEVKLPYYTIAFFTHVYTSIFLLLFGILQFSKKIRIKFPKTHKVIGKLYLIIILLFSGPASLIMGIHANGGLVSKISFTILSILWLIFTFLSLYYAKELNFKKHQQFAIRSFALTLSAISLRLFKYIIVFLWHPLPMDTYRIVSWLGWVINLLIAEIVIVYFITNKFKNGIKTK
ncbi:Predicted membrane protein [Flavobacterium sp. 9AF]|uniref:DUF2306 domain-containing protein n=1 Tax=Flavobacterium sp. 9AF TaxID=2653142 RepID=UPI0012EEF138|nr:DUF2306 domain-containing protein [Flavobacterium sp. 9AF]VXC24300.1 Predicted membrane protein [Flavobacterium sp. 9AF]